MKKKKLLLLSGLVLFTYNLSAQNIDDNKVTFSYIQLPLVHIDDKFDTYEVRVEHSYNQANEDSLAIFQMREETNLVAYRSEIASYQLKCDSIDRIYLNQMAAWEKKVNAGITNPDGTALVQPSSPIYPPTPVLARNNQPLMHSAVQDEYVSNTVSLQGFEKGLGGVMITLDIQPIRDMKIIETKTGTGASTKYQYKCAYIMPVKFKLESPTQGVLEEITLFEGVRYYNMKDFQSRYEHELYMKDNRAQMFTELEQSARNSSISEINNYLNNKFGYIQKSRLAEIYSVNRHKKWEYSDVTNAYTLTVQALGLVKNDRDRSGAENKLEEALTAWNTIMEESNLSDNAARINDKISAMIQCNIAEIQAWLSLYDACEMTSNLAKNSNIGKAKRHIEDEVGFYADQRKRWEANY